MRRVLYKNWEQSIYWIILFSLMTGLLFSNGEGVRLLPFPVSNESEAESSQAFLGKKTGFYNPSTHNSSSSLLKLNTKDQKSVKHLTEEPSSLSRLDVIESLNLRLNEVSGTSAVLYKSAHLISLSDRAPPLIS